MGFEPATFRTQGADPITEPQRPGGKFDHAWPLPSSLAIDFDPPTNKLAGVSRSCTEEFLPNGSMGSSKFMSMFESPCFVQIVINYHTACSVSFSVLINHYL